MDSIIGAMRARLGEIAPGGIAALEPLLEHSAKNIQSGNHIQLPDGSIMSARVIGVSTDNGEMLVPTVWNGQVLSDEEAAQMTGNWPVFASREEADKAAQLASMLMNLNLPQGE
jgi:hypothetical protein